ncbi:MAG: type I-C CRISPR-associated protein Cas7/Csd2 [Clostridia bacterium]|nr:type I-C CRISPR-associated protein Cas7/Csd2 [Clostridia bacterium]
MEAIKNRYEFTVLFDVENGNPNGDPDAGNMPRVDPETQHGIVTDVCIKRKIRNFTEVVKEGEPYYNILVKTDRSLNSKFTEAYDELGLKKGQKGKNVSDVLAAREYMCRNYFDVRTFGAVMSTGDDPCGIVRGPVQIEFARSIDPINMQDITITRQAGTKDTIPTMGKKNIVSYGLYRVDGYVSAMLAEKVTGFSEEDLELLWTAIINMFEHDRSAARGKMCVRKLFVFKHDSALGNAPAHMLFDKIRAEKNADIAVPRSFADYTVTVDNHMPDGVTLIEKL